MKYIFITLLFFFNISFASSNELSVALYGLDKKVANEKTVEKLLIKLFNKIEYLKDKKVKTYFYKDKKLLIEDLKSHEKKFDFLFTIPSLYLHYYEVFNTNSKNLLALSLDNSKLVEYYLITNKENKINSLSDLKNRSIVLQSADILSQIWLESLFFQSGLNFHKENIKVKKTQNYRMYKKVLDVYFNKVDLAIISSYTWNTSVDLNPNIIKKVRILKKSDKIFPPVISVAHKSIDKNTLKYFNDYVFNDENNEHVSNILSLVKVNKFEKVHKDDFIKSYEFYQNYLLLKEKYN